MEKFIIDASDYGVLCFIAGLGWGLWVATLIAAIMIDGVKWRKWARGQ